MATPKTDTATTTRKPNVALRKTKDELIAVKKRYSAKFKDLREEKLPNALINTTGTLLGAVPTGLICGAVPDEFEIMETKIPTGLIVEVGSVVLGGAVAGVSYAMDMPYGIHVGGGVVGAGSALLARRGAAFAREKAMEWWTKDKAPAAPYAVPAGG